MARTVIPLSITAALLVPIHLLEGLCARFGLAGPFYRLIAPLYAVLRPLLSFQEHLMAASIRPGQLVLEVGAGTGVLAERLADSGCRVVCLDRERQMLRRAPPRFASVQAEAEDLPFADGAFDHCVSLGAIHATQPARALKEMARVLCPGGEVQVLAETVLIPLFLPGVSAAGIREGFARAGLELLETRRIGWLYQLFRARRPIDPKARPSEALARPRACA